MTTERDSSTSKFTIRDIARAPAGESEQKLFCDTFQCGSNEFATEKRVNQAGQVEYFGFSPRGRIANGKGFVDQTDSATMYFRPGNQPSQTVKKASFDQAWTTEYYVDMDLNKRRSSSDPLGEVSFIYWNAGKFVLSLEYALADVTEMPTRVLLKSAQPTDVDKFTYKQINGQWFILDSVSDRVWFEQFFDLTITER